MKLQMAKDSLFAVLLRSPWWISVAVAAGIVALARLALPEEYRLVGMLTALPFLGIAAMAGWKQLRSPSAARVASTLEATAALSWREFNDALEEAFRHDGYAVTRLGKPAADFEMVKSGRTSLVSCKRWKAASTGVEPLRELHAAGEARASDENVYVTLGAVTDNARRFATEKRIRLIQGAELASLLRGRVGTGKRAA
ncbi:MAG: restriction endonuclease [Betaproteobacteria bacterium]|jgi:restriction system protein|nr:restriction endonuclease [Betaproteobacteria bacterium]MBK6600539.1 restriction endonuclease [Betaproteobacteria bacterium]MBK7081862.1 restriction endonuclease [Betaproteobacteria bacterium]MBK7593125.1 restriction endonuclease [Betaproteobacteria bacterium]MBK7742704.1 restriction endonuclease [Betaproteobacteria bacterium]